jgi:hypothetical protein
MIIVLVVAAADRRSGCRWPRQTASARSGGHESLWSRPYYSAGTASGVQLSLTKAALILTLTTRFRGIEAEIIDIIEHQKKRAVLECALLLFRALLLTEPDHQRIVQTQGLPAHKILHFQGLRKSSHCCR